MIRVVMVALAAMLLAGAAPKPGGVSREGMTAAERQRFDGASFPADCSVLFHYRASEEPGSVRGRATAKARDEMYDLVMARQSTVSRASVVASTEQRAATFRSSLLAGKFNPVEALDGFALCDEEYRLGLIKTWDIPTAKESWSGTEYYATREFVELCAGMYRYVAGFGTTTLSQAAGRAEGPATLEASRRGRRPYPEAVAAAAVNAKSIGQAVSDGRLGYDKVQLTVQMCDAQLGQSVDMNARMATDVCETTALGGIERRAVVLARMTSKDRKDVAGVAQARCSISKYTLDLLRQGKCTGVPLEMMETALAQDLATLQGLNEETGLKLACHTD